MAIYDQNLVNKNLSNTFNMNDNQILHIPKKKGRGGARPNSGRKVGSTVKLSAQDVLNEIALRDVPFAVGLAEDYIRARQSGDMHIIQRYQQMLLSKVIADKVETDITSGGQSLQAIFNFPTVEIDDFK